MNVYDVVLLPALIFFARIVDVSIGTMRIVLIARGYKLLAPLLAFIEILVWISVLGRVMENLTSPLYYVAYAGGFAAGNYVGLVLEEKLAMGKCVMRIITRRDAHPLVDALRKMGYGVTAVDAHGNNGEVSILYAVIERKDIDHYVEIINRFNPGAFYTIEDVRHVNVGTMPFRENRRQFVVRKAK
jgi:uncharacterized protein YebE (UPF0316 family)